MATLADLKRKLTIGQGVKMVSYYGMNPEQPNSKVGKVRYVIKVKSNGVVLNEDKAAVKGSTLDFPRASLLEIDDKGFKIYESGERELTAEEKQIRDNVPKDDKQSEIDMMTDGSTMFWREKAYYQKLGMEYLSGLTSSDHKGKHFNFNTGKIKDGDIKGELSLAYEWVD